MAFEEKADSLFGIPTDQAPAGGGKARVVKRRDEMARDGVETPLSGLAFHALPVCRRPANPQYRRRPRRRTLDRWLRPGKRVRIPDACGLALCPAVPYRERARYTLEFGCWLPHTPLCMSRRPSTRAAT